MISRKRSVSFGEGSLADVVAGEFLDPLSRGQSSKGLTRVDLTRRRDRFNSGGAANMRPGVALLSRYRIDA